MTNKRNVFTSLSGREVPIQPLSPTKLMRAEIGVENAFRDKGEPIDPPTYEVEVAGGGIEEHELDETAIESGDAEETARRQEAWDAHQKALTAMKAEQYNITRKIVLDSIDLSLPEDDSWVKEQQDNYIDVPEDPYERWVHWIETEVLLPQDIINIIGDILELSATGLLPEEDVQAAKKLFRRGVYGESESGESEDDTSGGDAETDG